MQAFDKSFDLVFLAERYSRNLRLLCVNNKKNNIEEHFIDFGFKSEVCICTFNDYKPYYQKIFIQKAGECQVLINSLIDKVMNGVSKPRNEKFCFYQNVEYSRWNQDKKKTEELKAMTIMTRNYHKKNISSSSESSSDKEDSESLNSESQGGQSLLDNLNANGNFKNSRVDFSNEEEFKLSALGESEATKSNFFKGISEIGMEDEYYMKNESTQYK